MAGIPSSIYFALCFICNSHVLLSAFSLSVIAFHISYVLFVWHWCDFLYDLQNFVYFGTFNLNKYTTYKVSKNLFKVMLVIKSHECPCLYISVNLNKGEINCSLLKHCHFIYRKTAWMIVKTAPAIIDTYIPSTCKIIG